LRGGFCRSNLIFDSGGVLAAVSLRSRLLVVQPMFTEGEKADEDFIALDNTQAGIGDTVLINREGNGARQVLNNPDACVISVIVGIIDSVYIAA